MLENQGPESVCPWCGDGLLTGDKVIMACTGVYSLETDDVTFEGDKKEYEVYHESCFQEMFDEAVGHLEEDEDDLEEDDEDTELTPEEEEVADMARRFK